MSVDKKRPLALFWLLVWIVSIITSIATQYRILIFTSMIYSLWFGSYVNDLGKKGKEEVGLL
jgi:hypothetical protein